MSLNLIYNLPLTQRRLLELIRTRRGYSRAELAVKSGLTPGSVTRNIKELLLLSLISEGEPRSGMRGQPALPILIRSDAAYSIGLTFTLDGIQAVAVDFSGKTVSTTADDFSGTSAKQLMDQSRGIIDRLSTAPPVAGKRILGVGVAIPGYFQSSDPIKMYVVERLKMLEGLDLNLLQEAFQQKTWIENNSSASALAEYYRRPNVDIHDLVLIHMGYGFSAGIVLDGKLHRGHDGNAGEIGLFYPREKPRPSTLDLMSILNAGGRKVDTIQDIGKYLEVTDPLIEEWIERASGQVRYITEIISVTIAPDEIIIGGALPERLIAKIVSTIKSQPVTIQPRYIHRRASQLGLLAPAIGAALLPIHQTCSPKLKSQHKN